jgi:CheY-like chemotaxis protein
LKKLHWLIVENDSDIIKFLQEAITRENKKRNDIFIELDSALHLEEAKKLIKAKKPFDVLLIDLMLPLDEKAYKKLEGFDNEEGLNIQRIIVLTDLLKISSPKRDEGYDKIEHLQTELSLIDDEINANIVIDGGYQILDYYRLVNNLKKINIPVICITARGDLEIQRECKQLVEDKYFEWLEKPVSMEKIINKALKLCQN